MNTKTIYAITQDSSEGEWTGPFYEKKSDAEEHVQREKEKRLALNMWVSEKILFLEKDNDQERR